MFANSFNSAYRHMRKHSLFTLINIFGLTVAMTACILILLFVRGELGYDKWLPEHEKVVRLHTEFDLRVVGEDLFQTVLSAGKMRAAIETQGGNDVSAATRLFSTTTNIIHFDTAYQESIQFVDPSFFQVFDVPLLYGDRATALTRPLEIVLTESVAEKYFGRLDVVGETLEICCVQGERMTLQVKGVMADWPDASHMDIQILAYMDESMFAWAPNILDTWTSVNVFTYFKLADAGARERLSDTIKLWLNTESPFVERFKSLDLQDGTQISDLLKLKLMPIADLFLEASKDAGNIGDMKPAGDRSMILTFAGISLLVLLVAVINFTNLATARAITRAREVAVRKVLGASRLQVASQFLAEAVLLALIATLLSLVVVELSLSAYNQAIDRSLALDIIGEPGLGLSILALGVCVGLLAGFYPAAILSGFLPARILKANKSAEVEGGTRLRNLLVVFQFAVSIGLVVCTTVVYAQTFFVSSLSLGYQADHKIAVSGFTSQHDATVRNSMGRVLAEIPGITGYALSSEVPSQDRQNNAGYTLRHDGTQAGKEIEETKLGLNYHSIDDRFMQLYGVAPVAGRLFGPDHPADAIVPAEEAAGNDQATIGQAGVILNESAARAYGFQNPADAIGRTLSGEIWQAGAYDLQIVGVIPDLYFRSVKFEIRPTAYFYQPERVGVLSVAFEPGADVSALRAEIEKRWAETLPLAPVTVRFVDSMIENMYDDDRRQGRLFLAFSLLAVVIACLGLYGLAAFTVERRTREIGIRKVMGAGVFDIVRLLIWQFSKPVVAAITMALPLAYLLMQDWLTSFVYRLDGSFILMASALAGGLAMLIAWLTVFGRAYGVAQTNPINALRYE